MPQPLRLGILLSGGGRTLQNLLDQIDRGTLPAEIAVVIASRKSTGGEAKAAARGIPTHVVRPKDFPTPEAFSAAVAAQLDAARVDLVCLAGFMVLWPVPERYLGRTMNIHPALIPAFCGQGMYGHHVHEAVIASGAKVSGCTVHFVDNEYDHGPIIVQRQVSVLAGDTPDSLAARVFEAECAAYPEAIRLFAARRLKVVSGRVKIL
jgi:formyltetrahydrofolate-dependent phosphoribosylglycinamide formyltransferase